MKLDIKRERINDPVGERRAAGLDLGGRRERFTRSQLEKARRLIDASEPANHVARDPGMSRATFYRRPNRLETDLKPAVSQSQRRRLTAATVATFRDRRLATGSKPGPSRRASPCVSEACSRDVSALLLDLKQGAAR
jgi:hypothetical protein